MHREEFLRDVFEARPGAGRPARPDRSATGIAFFAGSSRLFSGCVPVGGVGETAGILAGALGTGRLPVRVTPRAVLTTGLALGALGMSGLATVEPRTGYAVLLIAQLVVGLGVGTALTTIVVVTLQDVLPDDSGVASALTNATQQIGGAVGISILNALALAVTGAAADPRSASALTGGYSAAFLTGVGLLAAAALIALVTLRSSDTQQR
ncbi:hypothetical protein [Streptosporangium carneum]|uniref:hypothetical protein n=1 Tax=Streptosporangium carneum TaxID=47481 RepID=UPI0022F320C7|nr:hypothetical protein [Streptosporangium carneum]